jgi:hypothetical protein
MQGAQNKRPPKKKVATPKMQEAQNKRAPMKKEATPNMQGNQRDGEDDAFWFNTKRQVIANRTKAISQTEN